MIKTILQKSTDETTLRTKSIAVDKSKILSEEISQLKVDLVDTLRAQKAGIAISSVQIGNPIQLFILEVKATPNRPELKPLGPLYYFNPEIIHQSKDIVEMYEACLSVNNADLYGNVRRVESISIKYLDEKGEEKFEEHTGFLARVILHELDHLDGKLFTDLADPKSLMDAKSYRKMRSKGVS